MRPMKNRPDPIKGDPHPRTTSFGKIRTERTQERLNLCPLDFRLNRIFEDRSQSISMTVVQR